MARAVAAKCSQTPPLRILLTGASGFLGSELLLFLRQMGHEVVCLIRKAPSCPLPSYLIAWNPRKELFSKGDFERFDAVIHLAGANLFEKRWSAQRKKEVIDSRCHDTQLLAKILSSLDFPPKTVIGASAIGYYGHRERGVSLIEEDLPGKGFLADLCVKWEEALKGVSKAQIRVVNARFGLILSPKGGVLKKILPIFRWGLGGKLGSGEQILSWIALEDALFAIAHVLFHSSLQGPVNFVAPFPVSQAEFTKILAQKLHRPAFFYFPAFLLKGLGGERCKELLLQGASITPRKLLDSGYLFHFPFLSSCFEDFL